MARVPKGREPLNSPVAEIMRTPATNISSLCGLSCLVLSLCIFIGLPAPATAVADDQIFIRINQLGYQSRQPKLVIAFARSPLPEKFCVIDAQSNHVAFNGTAKPLAGRWGEFPYHVELDFSSLQQTGRYFIEIGKGKTRTFEISDSTYAGVPDELLEFMRQQRCGYNPWLDAPCHTFDGRTAYGPLPAGTYIDARGGWHDAGDLLKYLLTSSNATAQMLLAFKLRPSHFA